MTLVEDQSGNADGVQPPEFPPGPRGPGPDDRSEKQRFAIDLQWINRQRSAGDRGEAA
jgi:hypothetical protein